MKRILLILGSILGLLLLAAGAAVAFFPKDFVAAELKKQVLASTGRTLTMDPAPAVSFWPALGLSAKNVTLSNPADMDGAFLTAREVVFAVAAAPLLRGDVEIKRIFLAAPQLRLVARKDGAPNWTFPAEPSKAGEPERRLRALKLDDLTIADGALTYTGPDGGEPVAVSDIDATLALASLDTPATLKGSLSYRGEALDLEATIGKPRALLEQGATPLNLRLDAAPLDATLDGAVNTATGAVTGKLAAKGASLRKVMAWQGASLAPGDGFGPFDVTADLNARLPTIAFARGAYRLDAITARGDVALTIAESGRLAVNGALTIPTLDVNPYLPAAPATKAAAPGGVNVATGWDAKPLDLAGLRAMDADLNLGVDDLRFQKMQFTNGQLRLRLANGVADAQLSRVSLYEGGGAARLVVGADGAVRTEIDVADVQALPLLTAAIGFDKIEGRGRLKASLAGRGRSQADLMHALAGSASFSFSDGAWRGVNLAQVARQVQAALAGETVGAAAKTDFAEFAADFTVANGVATTQNLRLLNPFVRLDGKGTLDIGAQTTDLRLAPRAVRSAEGQGGDALARGLGIPFRASGPWSGIKFRPDGQVAVEQALGGRSIGDALGGLVGRATKQKEGEPSLLDGLLQRKK